MFDRYLKIRPCLAWIKCQNFDSLSWKTCFEIQPLFSWIKDTIKIVGSNGTYWNQEWPPKLAGDGGSTPPLLGHFHAPLPLLLMAFQRRRSCHPHQLASSGLRRTTRVRNWGLELRDWGEAVRGINTERERGEGERERFSERKIEGKKEKSLGWSERGTKEKGSGCRSSPASMAKIHGSLPWISGRD